jgi:hypothetical protein
MNRRLVVICVLFTTVAIVPPAQSAPRDYASLRKAADAFAAQSKPGSKLWRVDLTGSYRSGSLQIQQGEFHYFLWTKAGLDMLRLQVKSLEGMYLPQVESRTDTIQEVQKWQMTPVPGNILSPDDALRRLNRPLPDDPYGAVLRLNLVQTSAALADYSWASVRTLGTSMDVDIFFFKTSPLGKWIWWTVVKQDRPLLGRVHEYIYIDAVTGKATSACQGPRTGLIPCQAEAQPGIQPGSASLLMVTGQVKSASAGRLVIVTDRDMSVSLRRGTAMTFELNQPHLQSINFQSGDLVTIHYENQSGRMIPHEISFRGPDR